jgi:hypothetical protein
MSVEIGGAGTLRGTAPGRAPSPCLHAPAPSYQPPPDDEPPLEPIVFAAFVIRLPLGLTT